MAGNSLRDIKRRIRSVKSTQQITKAMKMVAAAKLRRAQDRVIQGQPYFDAFFLAMSKLAGFAGELKHSYLQSPNPETNKDILLLLSSDKGLCGSFNVNLNRSAERFIHEHSDRNFEIVTLGRKGRDYFKSRGYSIRRHFPGFTSECTFADLRDLMLYIEGAYLKGEINRVYIHYARFVNVLKNIPTIMQVLPVEPPKTDEKLSSDMIFEPKGEELLGFVLPRYFQSMVFRTVIESFTSEQGARMVAMENATSAAGDMIEAYTLLYNKARQGAITRELGDIIGGSEAQK